MRPTELRLTLRFSEDWLSSLSSLGASVLQWPNFGGGEPRFEFQAPFVFQVGEHNLMHDIAPQPIEETLRGLAEALNKLAALGRAEFDFQNSPLNLAMEERPDGVVLSLFELRGVAAFRLEGALFEREAFVEALSAFAGSMRRTLARTERTFLGRMEAAVQELEQAVREFSEAAESPEWSRRTRRYREALPIEAGTSADGGLEIHTRLDPQATGLDRVEVSHGEERYLLLAPGVFTLHDGRGQSLRIHCRPLHLLELLVDDLVALRTRLQGNLPLRTLIATSTGRLHLRSLGPSLVLIWEGEHGMVSLALSRSVFSRAISEHVAVLTRALLGQNPTLEKNQLFGELVAQARLLGSLSESVVAAPDPGAAEADRPEEDLAEGSANALPLASGETVMPGISNDALLQIHLERSWTLGLSTPSYLRAEPLGEHDLVIRSERNALVIRGEDGRPIEPPDQIGPTGAIVPVETFMAGGLLVRLGQKLPSPVVHPLVHSHVDERWMPGLPVAGCTRFWAVAREDRRISITRVGAGDAPVLTAPLPGIPRALDVGHDLVVVLSEGVLHALEAKSGRALWAVSLPWERVSLRIMSHGVVVAADDPMVGYTAMGLLSLGGGEWLSRREWHGEFRALSWTPDVGVAALISDGDGLRLSSLGTAGEWESELPEPPDLKPLHCRHFGRVVVAGAGGRVMGFDAGGERWRLPQRRGDWQLVSNRGQVRLLPVVGPDSLELLDPFTGQRIHEIRAFWEEIQEVVHSPAGHLTLIESLDGDMRLIHRLEMAGMLAVLQGGRSRVG